MAVDTDTVVMAVDMVVMVATGVDTTARGLLMLRPRLSLATAMVATATAVDMVAMAATGVDTTARGLLMPSPRLMLLLRLDTAMAVMAVAMVATVEVMVV